MIDFFVGFEGETEGGMEIPERKASLQPQRVRIASLSQLKGFDRIGADTLIHTSERDLWTVRREGAGVVIERMFDGDGTPLKG